MDIRSSNNNANISFKILLALGDLVLLYFALWLALALRYHSYPDWLLFIEHAKPFTAVYILWIGLFYTGGLYNLIRIRDQVNIYYDLVRALLLGTVLAILIFYILPYS